MHDSDTGPTPQRDKENSAVPVMTYSAIVVGTIAIGLFAAGLGAMGATGYKIGAYAGYGAGLMMVGTSVTLMRSVGALFCHRAQLRDNARTRAEIRKLRIEVARWNAETNNGIGTLRGEISTAQEENNRDHKALLNIETRNSNALCDELAARRDSN